MGITNNKLCHCLGVARQCYKIAKEKYDFDEEAARGMFVVGFNHDIGYEFCDKPNEHPMESARMLDLAFGTYNSTIARHGNPCYEQTISLRILNEADLTVSHTGDIITAEERLLGIKQRYGEDSREYINAIKLAKDLALVEEKWGTELTYKAPERTGTSHLSGTLTYERGE